MTDTPILDTVAPRVGRVVKIWRAIKRIPDALFARAQEVHIPGSAEPVATDASGNVRVVETTPSTTVRTPQGVARDPTVLILFFGGLLYQGLGLFIELPFTVEDFKEWLVISIPLGTAIITRIKSKNMTRG